MQEHRLCGDTDLASDHRGCLTCLDIWYSATQSTPLRSPNAVVKAAKWVPERAMKYWMGRAHSVVAKAKVAGILPALDGSIKCTDCDRPAKVYDHRDYGKPLSVDPVCLSCNRVRGSAQYPTSALA